MDVSFILAPIAAALVSVLGTWLGALRSTRAEKKERDRLVGEVLGTAAEPGIVVGDHGVIHIHTHSAGDTDQDLISGRDVSTQIAETPDTASSEGREAGVPEARSAGSPREKPVSETETTYDKLLINDYALGLTQARRAFNVSTMFSILGGLVLIIGVSLAIFRADTGGQVAGAIITSTAGVLTAGLSQLFREQSTKALKHLESQATELRRDVRDQKNAANTLRLLREVSDDDLRARLQAALILKFSGAVLPDLGAHSKPRSDLNGSSNRDQVDITIVPASQE